MRSDAVNLPWMVRKLQEEKPDMFAMWVEHIRTTLPHIVAIDTCIDEQNSSAYLQVEYQGGYTLTSAGLSNGTLAMLALTILPYLPDLPELVCLAEPENSVHLHKIETILHSLRSLYNSQVWVSTHSPMILAHTEAKSIILMRETGNNAIEAVTGTQYPRLRLWQSRINQSAYLLADVLD
jgi:predicted ATPase